MSGSGREGTYADRSRTLLMDEPGIRDAVTAGTLSFDAHRRAGWGEVDAEAWRDWAAGAKSHGLGRLDEMLERFEERVTARGVRVHWAPSADDARRIVTDIVEGCGVAGPKVVKGKSMLSEELGVNELLEGLGAEVFETDLGEFVIQLLGEPPSHILGPAIHRSLEDIRVLFGERFGTAPDASPEALAAVARSHLRDAFLTADIGMTGGNFLVAETGTLVLLENEGNIRLTTSVPRVHVALVGIEKALPRWKDVPGMVQLTARTATGQPAPIYASMIQGPRGDEEDGPEEVHVVLVDNGRSRLLADDEMWEALRCVRCGACLNTCPVYRQTGGHPWGWAYSGPIGAVLAPSYLGLEAAWDLPYASTLCGACGDVCPVRIPLPEMLQTWRVRAVEAGVTPRSQSVAMAGWAALAERPGLFHAAGEVLGAMPALGRSRSLPVVGAWVRERGGLEPSGTSFHRDSGGAGVDEAVATPRGSAAGAAAAKADQPHHGSPTPAPRTAPDASPREVVLERIRAALDGREPWEHPGAFPGVEDPGGAGRPGPSAVPAAFVDAFRRTGAEAHRFETAADALEWIRGAVAGSGDVVAGAGVLAEALDAAGVSSSADPARAAVGLSRARGAAADTGTLLLASTDRRAPQLLPPTHLVWIDAADIHATLTEAVGAVLDETPDDIPAVLALHSGPSKSADIGRIVVTGVHGPGRVVALVVGPAIETERNGVP